VSGYTNRYRDRSAVPAVPGGPYEWIFVVFQELEAELLQATHQPPSVEVLMTVHHLLLATNPHHSGKIRSFGGPDNVPETFGFWRTETVPETFGFRNSLGSRYSVPET
jgi:hypothetical protein